MPPNRPYSFRSPWFGLVLACAIIAVFLIVNRTPPHQEPTTAKHPPKEKTPTRFKAQPSELLQDLRGPASRFRESSSLTSKEMLDLLAELSSPLSDDEITLFLSWLVNNEGHHLSEGAQSHVANEVLNLLGSQKPIPLPLINVLSSIAEGHNSSPLALRTYAVQHMRLIWEKLPQPEPRRHLEDALWRAVDLDPSNLKATALFALHGLANPATPSDSLGISPSSWHIPTPKLRDHAEKFLADPQAPPDLRMVSLRILKEREVTSATPLIRTIVAGPSQSIPLKLSAIHALGKFGNPADLELLHSLADLPFHQQAVQAAISTLSDSK